MGGSKISKAAKEGYYNATRTVICQYCSKIRSTENLHQIKPRIKCKDCHENRKYR